MKIIRLQAENIKKLTVVEIEPTGELVQITGKNGSGKSSVLDSIWWALAGTGNIQKQPIRQGAEHAKIKLDMGEITVTRTFTENGSQLSVLGKGVKYTSPQVVLNEMLGALSFDPLAFSRMKERQQFDTLKLISKLDTDIEALDAANRKDYDSRTILNREVKSLEAQISGLGEIPASIPAKPIDVTALAQQIATAGQSNADIDLKSARRQDALKRADSNAGKAQTRIAELESLLETTRADLARFIEQIKQIKSEVDAPKIDTSALVLQLEQSKETNRLVALKQKREELSTACRKKTLDADSLTDAMKEREKAKAAAIESAKMPIKGLSFGDGTVLYNGIPLDQASSAEQLRISCAIGMAGNPKLKVMLIKDGSLLDADSLKLLGKLAKDNDWQIWIERVDTSGQVGVVMEDGHVKQSAHAAVEGRRSGQEP